MIEKPRQSLFSSNYNNDSQYWTKMKANLIVVPNSESKVKGFPHASRNTWAENPSKLVLTLILVEHHLIKINQMAVTWEKKKKRKEGGKKKDFKRLIQTAIETTKLKWKLKIWHCKWAAPYIVFYSVI